MALIQRLFNSRERRGRSWGFRCGKNERNFETPESLASYKTWNAPEFEASQIHLLIFRERDGKKLLFDSRAIKKKEDMEKQAPRSTPCSFAGPFSRLKPSSTSSLPRQGSQESLASAAEQNGSPGPGGGNSNYTFLRPNSDVKLLGEMMFGSVAMIYRGPLLKVHTIKVPPQLLLSQVFVLKPPKDAIDQDSIDKDSLPSSDLGMRRSISMTSIGEMDKEPVAHSMPVAVPQSPYRSHDNSPAASASSNSFLTPFPSPLSNGSTTPSSFHKRWLRNQVTSMENGVMRRRSSDVMEEPIGRRERNPKISIGIVISLFEEGDVDKMQQFQSFFFSHFNLIEGHFYKLSCAIEKALTYQKRNYIQPVMQALQEFRSSVHALYTAPRIKKPIWLNMMTFPLQRNHLCEHLMRELTMLLDSFNNRQTNFFLSRLLTGVLTHHLAWVPTVMPAGATPNRAYLDKHSSTTLDWLAKSHPYNPLWAQLGDMYGAVGYPNKVAKTIIVGKKADLVCRLLYILTYFIRCSEVHESLEKREQVVMEYKEVALNCGYDFIQATESGYHSDPSAPDNEDQFTSLTSDPTHHLESSLETVEETSESLASPVESSAFVLDRKKLTLAEFKANFKAKTDMLENDKTELHTPEDGERTPVGVTPEPLIKWKDDDSAIGVKCEFVAPVRNAASDQNQTTDGGILISSGMEEKHDVNLTEERSCDSKDIVVRCKDDVVLERKCELEIPVGHSSMSSRDTDSEQPLIKCKDPVDTILNPKYESVALVGHANHVIRQEIRCKDDTMLEVKKESVAHVGRSGETLDQTPCTTLKTDDNENKLMMNIGRNCVNMDRANGLINSRNHICDLQGLKLASKQCNSTQGVNSNNPETSGRKSPGLNPETSGRKSPGLKEAHDLYHQTDTKSEVSVLNQAERAFLRSLSSSSSTSSVFSSDIDSGLWMGVNKGSEVMADTRPSAELYTRAISTHSTTSSHSYDTDGTLTPDHEELPLAFSELLSEIETKSNYTDNFGRSLLGGLSQKYVPEMALHGVAELDVQEVMSELELSVQHSVLDEAITEAVYIVADTDKLTVELLSSERPAPSEEKPLAQEIACSDSVLQLLDSVQLLWNMRMPPDYCLMHLEDSLQQLYFKSTLMAAYLDKNPTSCHKDLSVSLGVETSDIPLLLGVTSVHAPQVIMNILRETFEKEALATP
ncbi:folliculin-interacting protein 2-like isoform X2 [Amphiura filiformis]|uniref:folliculin-interacting protein 2-like isoform X2 n=1 Tax=Amphiura filiformis TaxID=82378 RepID=UPI003B2186A0